MRASRLSEQVFAAFLVNSRECGLHTFAGSITRALPASGWVSLFFFDFFNPPATFLPLRVRSGTVLDRAEIPPLFLSCNPHNLRPFQVGSQTFGEFRLRAAANSR